MAAVNTISLVASLAVALVLVIASLTISSMRCYLKGWIILGVSIGATLLVDRRLVPEISWWPVRITSAVLALWAGVVIYRAWTAQRRG